MAAWIWFNIGSDGDLLPDSTKPFPESMLLTNHQWSRVACNLQEMLKISIIDFSFKITAASPMGQRVKQDWATIHVKRF